MAPNSFGRLLFELETSRYSFGRSQAARVAKLLRRLETARFPDPPSLIRFHEILMFLRAFPHSPSVLRKTETLLNNFWKRVDTLRQSVADMDAFEPIEVSGIAGTQMEDTLSFDLADWLTRRLPGKVEIAWDHYDPGRELGTTGPRFMPLLEDDAYVEADTPWRRWLETAAGKKRSDPAWLVAKWLVQRFAGLPLAPIQKAELYESLRVPLRWDLGNSRISRTRNFLSTQTLSSRATRRPGSPAGPILARWGGRERSDRGKSRDLVFSERRGIFYRNGPLISRSEVSLARELAKRPPTLTKLSRRQGEAVIDTIREVMLVRYRELYGTTLGDPSSVVRADVGRGVSIYLWNLPPERRLPLRAYVAGLTMKNGVPINYIESIGLCEWMEVGFNTFYTFRGGEAGWIYAQVLRCLCHLMGTTCISVYPYQLGHDNDEAIESGAFWFYRKLGFRPGRPELQKLVEREEKKIAASQACGAGISARQSPYRTPPRILKRLAAGHVFYELPGSEIGAWDKFSTRNIGLRVNRHMARNFGGDAGRMREYSKRALEKILGVRTDSWTPLEKVAFENFALVLTEVENVGAWTRQEKKDLLEIIRAKPKPDEMLYLHLTQQHNRLRDVLLRAGS
jgi:hypothetical protein